MATGDGEEVGGEKAELTTAPAAGLARTRSEETVARLTALGKQVADYLRANEGCFQLEAAIHAGIAERRYYRYLDGESEACEAFQMEVLPALFEQAKKHEEKAEKDIGSAESGSGAWATWHKWKLEKRYRKLFGDLAQKVELSGPEGGPIESAVRYVVSVPQAEPEDE